MFHLTFFGGTEGEIAPSGFTAMTVFGGAELRRPTVANQLLHLKRTRERPRSRWERFFGSNQNLILTLFGGTVMLVPTMVEEYAALNGMIRSGSLHSDELSSLIDQLSAQGNAGMFRTVTLFGACVARQPSAAKERKALDAAARAGTLTDRVRQALDDVIGSPPGARIHTLGQLATT